MRRCTGVLGAIAAIIFSVCQSPSVAQTVVNNGMVQGTAASGSDAKGFPVQVGGVTSAGKAVRLLVDADGTLHVVGGGGSGGSGGVVTQPDQTLLKGTMYQGGTWSTGISNWPSTWTLGPGNSVIGHAILDASGAMIGHIVVDSGTVGVTGNVAVTGTFYPYTLGQKLDTASVPVVLTAAQVSALTPLSTITANAGTGIFSTSRTWTLSSGSDSITTVPSGTQAVSGTFWQGVQPVSQSGAWNIGVTGTVTANLGTIGGAATAAKQPALGTAGSASSDVITVQGAVGMTPFKTDGSAVTQPISGSVSVSNFPSTQNVAGTFWQSIQPVSGTFWQATQPVSGTFWPYTLGQQVSGSSVPVVLPAAQITALTPPTTVVVTQPAGENLHSVTDSGSTTTVTGNVTAVQPIGTNLHTVVDSAPTTAVTGTFWQATQPVSISTSVPITASALPLPTGAAQDSTLTNATQKAQLVGSSGNVAVIDTAGNQAVKGGSAESSGSAAALNADIIASIDVRDYKSFSLQIPTQASGGVTNIQVSDDNTNFVNLSIASVSNTTSSPSTVLSGTGLYVGNISWKWMRVRETSWTSGTATGILELFTHPVGVATIGGGVSASQTGTWTMQQGSTASSTPWNVASGGTTTVAITSGNASNTVVKASAGHLCRVLVTTTNTNPMVIYDNSSTTSGTVIGALPASPAVGTTYDFQMPAASGITVGGNAANPGVTISYSN